MTDSVNYSALDRLVHRLAFSSPAVQLAAAEVDQASFRRSARHVELDPPVFITSLPRAGTTVLLELLVALPGFCASSYRDMPFALAPKLWSRVSAAHRKTGVAVERAHGDGMSISYDSAEALEEIAWKALLPGKYERDRIELCDPAELTTEICETLTTYMQRLVATRLPAGIARGRYVSKNNGNVSRLRALKKLAPDCKIVLPFRSPMDHAASMREQHLNFAARHRESSFTRKYMRDLGHFEFGELHRPFDFPTLQERIGPARPESLDYWLGYWTAGFEHVLMEAVDVIFVSYDRACLDGPATIGALAERLGVARTPALESLGSRLTPSTRRAPPTDARNAVLRARALEIHAALLDSSIV